MRIKKQIRKKLLVLPESLFYVGYNAFLKLCASKISVKRAKNSIKIVDKISIFITERERLIWYERGVNSRLHLLADQYMLKNIPLSNGDTIIDCGANIGEIGVYLRQQDVVLNYIAFEPSQDEFNCCCLNNPHGTCFQEALWNTCQKLTFYKKTDTADSSVFAIKDFTEKVTISAITLEEVFLRLHLQKVKLLKVEAEGAEPEILEGASTILDKIDYVVVDAGPERGMDQMTTVVSVVTFLLSRGFEFIGFEAVRCVCLFRNSGAKHRMP